MNEPVRISQDMIRLYDEYTHLTLDRRDFMGKLAKLTGSAAAAAAVVPLLEANQARAAIVPEDDARLKTETVTYPSASGDMQGYLAMMADTTGKLVSNWRRSSVSIRDDVKCTYGMRPPSR